MGGPKFGRSWMVDQSKRRGFECELPSRLTDDPARVLRLARTLFSRLLMVSAVFRLTSSIIAAFYIPDAIAGAKMLCNSENIRVRHTKSIADLKMSS